MATRRPPAQQQHPQPQRPQQPRLRSLRIGVILGGNIIEERLVRKRETITIGQSVKNTFSIPVEGLPRQWPLFMVKDGRYFIHFSNSMDGRISDGGQIYPIATLKGHGAQQHGEGWVMPLTENARGKIVLGEMTLLFQFVSAPPLQPRPHLPASVRGSLADRIEPQLSIIVALSICMHFSVFFYAKYCHDPGTRTRAEQIYKAQFQAEKVVDISFDEPVDGAATGAEDKPAEDKPAEDPGKKGGDKGGDKGDKGDAGKSSGPSDEEEDKPKGLLEQALSGVVGGLIGRGPQAQAMTLEQALASGHISPEQAAQMGGVPAQAALSPGPQEAAAAETDPDKVVNGSMEETARLIGLSLLSMRGRGLSPFLLEPLHDGLGGVAEYAYEEGQYAHLLDVAHGEPGVEGGDPNTGEAASWNPLQEATDRRERRESLGGRANDQQIQSP